MSETATLRLTNISKSFAVVHALRDVQLELRSGEVDALLGENGAGKSTLDAIANGKIKGVPGDKFTAGKLGSYTVNPDGTVLLGKPTIFSKDNIDQFNF